MTRCQTSWYMWQDARHLGIGDKMPNILSATWWLAAPQATGYFKFVVSLWLLGKMSVCRLHHDSIRCLKWHHKGNMAVLISRLDFCIAAGRGAMSSTFLYFHMRHVSFYLRLEDNWWTDDGYCVPLFPDFKLILMCKGKYKIFWNLSTRCPRRSTKKVLVVLLIVYITVEVFYEDRPFIKDWIPFCSTRNNQSLSQNLHWLFYCCENTK